MKLLGKILAALIAGVIAVLAVQQVFRRVYMGWLGLGKKYVDLPSDEADEPDPEE